MQVLSHAEFFWGLFSIVGSGILIVVVISKSPRFLHDEVANRVKQSIAVLETCAQPLAQRSTMADSWMLPLSLDRPAGVRRTDA